MKFRGYAFSETGFHEGGIFLANLVDCANFIIIAASRPNVERVMITDIFDAEIASTFPHRLELEYLDSRYAELYFLLDQTVHKGKPIGVIDFMWLDEDDRELMAKYLNHYDDRFGTQFMEFSRI